MTGVYHGIRMTEELNLPRESLSSLGAQFTGSVMKKVTAAVQKLLADGWSEAKILRKMKDELRSFRPFTIQRLFDKAAGRAIADDIASGNVVSEKELKAGTIEVELSKIPAGIESDCMVQFRGADWYVARARGKAFTLKLLR